MPYNLQPNLTHVSSVSALRNEQNAVRQRLKMHESELTRKLYEIPAELAAAGANRFIPKFLRGKVTDAALSGGKKLINHFLVPGDDNSHHNKTLPGIQKGMGILGGIKSAISLFKKFR